jgi:hypothetical protein
VLVALVACSAFQGTDATEPGPGPDGGGSPADAGDAASLDGGTGDGADADVLPKTFCQASAMPFLLCSDFEASTDVAQPTKPAGVPWQPQQINGSVAVVAGEGYASSNGLRAGGNGATSLTAQVEVGGLVVMKDVIHLSFKMNIAAPPPPNVGDIFLASLTFDNTRVAVVLRPQLGGPQLLVSQQSPPTSSPSKSPPNPNMLTPSSWGNVELLIDRSNKTVDVKAGGLGIGVPVGLLVTPSGNAVLAAGIGYCDPPCGQPTFDFDDVLLTEE